MKQIFTLSLVSPFLSNVRTSTSTHYRTLVAYSKKQQKYRNTQRRSLSSHTPDDTSLDHVTNDDDDSIDAPSLFVVDQIINQKSSFRRHRVKIANQLLIEYDRTAFGGLLLLQPPQEQQQEQQPMSGTIPPNVIIQWSNRLRTTAGRAHLLLHRPMMRDKKKSSLNEQIFHMELLKERISNKCDNHTSNVSPDTLSVVGPPLSSLPQGVRRTAIVELSTKVVDDELRLQTTLLHELCHVAAWMVDGNVKPPHGPYFQKWVTIVTNTIQPTIPITTKHTFEIHYKYTWECINPSCSVTLFRRHNRRSIDIQRHVCGKCCGPLREINTTPSHSKSCLVDDTIIRVQNNNSNNNDDDDSTTKRINHPTTRQRPLTEYHRFIQTHTKRVTKQLLQQQKQKLKQSSTTTATTRRKQTQIKKVSPQKVMKECAKLWQLYKKSKTTGK